MVAAWIIATWVVEAFDISAYLVARSPTRECGKTRLLEVIQELARKPFSTISASEASLFRIVDKEGPTVIMDESEALSGRSDRAVAIRSILNAAHRRGPGVPRCEGERNDVRWFRVFGFYAIAAIGKLWDTIEGRSIILKMQRKSPSDKLKRFRLRQVKVEAQDSVRKIARWAQDHLKEIEAADPELPDFMGDREQDIWECLLKVGQIISQETYEELVKAAKSLQGEDEDNAPQIQLLRDLKVIISKYDQVFSETLCRELWAMEDRQWPEYRNGKPITQNQLARLLKNFQLPDGLPLRPRKIRIGEDTKQGYRAKWFEKLFETYAPDPPLKVEQPEQSSNGAGFSEVSNRNTAPSCSTSKTNSNPHEQRVVPGVPDESGGAEEENQNKGWSAEI